MSSSTPPCSGTCAAKPSQQVIISLVSLAYRTLVIYRTIINGLKVNNTEALLRSGDTLKFTGVHGVWSFAYMPMASAHRRCTLQDKCLKGVSQLCESTRLLQHRVTQALVALAGFLPNR
eukprot:6270-Prorocentrum_minimum.AAC.3